MPRSYSRNPADVTRSYALSQGGVNRRFSISTGVGPAGQSAYQIAVANGFVGDEAAWLASLEGDGLTGAEIKALYEGEPNTNEYTDSEQAKVGNLPADTNASLALKANAHNAALTGTTTAEDLFYGGLTTYGTAATFLYLGSAAATHRTALGLGTAATANSGDFEAAGAVATHEADTTSVHGIADTSQLRTVTQIQALIDAAVASLIDGAPGTIDTLNELAAALGDDPNFATTVAADIAARVAKATYTANSLLIAHSSATPEALEVAEGRIVGRITGGQIAALTAAQIRTILNVEDGADVTDAANVEAAGALMDSEVVNLAAVKAFNPADYASAGHTHPGQIHIEVGNGVDVITPGIKKYIRIPYGWTITAAICEASPAGDIVWDVLKGTVTTDPPTDVTASITDSAPPTLTAATYSVDNTLTGWTLSGTAGEYVALEVVSAATVTKASLTLSLTRT